LNCEKPGQYSASELVSNGHPEVQRKNEKRAAASMMPALSLQTYPPGRFR